ncbi:microtubule-associated protein futsch-like [Dendronephthya gigantea]|uniref:microtubule-associated protein futsch-like n=1 Tax=Dendronephthya gigantea TaxID=151771 RepID=UPI00106CF72C|nr:microtubule-associated protein futsch-like [Dendronephthya gigantea]
MASLNIENWTPSNVAEWIKGLGPQFESCAESFVDEEINGKALLTINTEYLGELDIKDSNDQNAVLDAVRCLIEVESCLQEETVHGQVVVVNSQTKKLIDKLEKEGLEASEGDVNTSQSSMKNAEQVYQLAKKLLSWLLRTPFSEMNACWPLKDSVCRVVRDMTDESLLKNREHLQENLKKIQLSFENFLNEEPLHEAFKQPSILVNEEFTLEGEGLGIGITTIHHIHTVNSVAVESPAGKNGNIKNGDEIVNVNGQCVIAWPQKNVINLMKLKDDSVSLTLKKLPLVKGPLNKPSDKTGTPLSEMNVVMDRTKVVPERQARAEMKEAGIKEETSLEMQAIENENAAEENSKVEARIEGIKEEEEGKQDVVENGTSKVENVEPVPEKDEEKKVEEQEAPAKDKDKTGENEIKVEAEKDGEVEKPEDGEKEAESEELKNGEKVDETKPDDVEKNGGETKEEAADKTEEEEAPVVAPEDKSEEVEAPSEDQGKIVDTASGEGNDGAAKIEENGDVNADAKEAESLEKKAEVKNEKIVNGEATVETPQKLEIIQTEKTDQTSSTEPKKTEESDPIVEINVQAASPKKEASELTVTQNGENDVPTSPKPEPVSPSKKPSRPDLPRMKMGSVKNVTVGGTKRKEVEVYGVVRRQKNQNQIAGTATKRISCIELGEADCEGWLTKRSGGHGLTPTRWRRQWCVLKEEHLYYYKTSFDREAGGVIEMTGYNMSASPEIKKPFAFKCEKDGAKKYFFHADNEVDREMWIKALNATARGEKKPKETGVPQMHENAERKGSVSGLKVSQANRPRTGSVLAGIRFNYYDDEDIERDRKVAHEPAQRENEGLVNGQKADPEQSTGDENAACQNVLKIAAGVSDDEKKTDSNEKNTTDEANNESQEKGGEEQAKDTPTTNVDNIEHNKDSQDTSESKDKTVNEDSSVVVGTQEGTIGKDSAEMNEDVATKSEEETVKLDDSTTKSEVKSETSEDAPQKLEDDTTKCEDVSSGSVEETVKPEDTTTKSEQKVETCKDDVPKSEEETTKPEDVTLISEVETKQPENSTTTADDTVENAEVVTPSSEEDTTKPEDREPKSEDSTTKSEDSTTKSDDSTTKSEDNVETPKSDETTVESNDCTANSEDKSETCEEKAETSEEKPKDEFEEVAESIKEAEIGIDGSEKSAGAILRKLSMNSESEIMDKVVKLRILRQSLKDKEQSMDAIDELLTSEVTPESIAQWRAKYETITNSSENGNDLNENSQL